jgi:SulP family sulfate permease
VTGLKVHPTASFIESWGFMLTHLKDINPYSFGIGIITILIALIFLKISSKLPHLFISMVLSSLAAYFLADSSWQIPLVGYIPSSLPHFEVPANFNFDTINDLLPGAFAVAILGLIEVVTISRTIAIKSRQSLDSNKEFMGLGLSNMVGGFFSSYAGSGSFTRSALNYELGAKTPMSSIFASLILMAIVLFITPLAEHLPIPTIGGIILIIAFKFPKRVNQKSRYSLSLFFPLCYLIYNLLSWLVYFSP